MRRSCGSWLSWTQPGVKFSEVARRHDVSRGLLWQWRDAQRRGRLVAETPGFLPLQVVPELAAPEPPGGSGPPPCAGPPDLESEPDERIEIVLPDGTAVRVAATITCGDPAPRAGGAARMIPVPSGVRVWLAVGHTDMRRGMNSLALQVQQALGRDPHCRRSLRLPRRSADLIKILWHDGIGMSLYAKRLERGRFIWPSPADGMVCDHGGAAGLHA